MAKRFCAVCGNSTRFENHIIKDGYYICSNCYKKAGYSTATNLASIAVEQVQHDIENNKSEKEKRKEAKIDQQLLQKQQELQESQRVYQYLNEHKDEIKEIIASGASYSGLGNTVIIYKDNVIIKYKGNETHFFFSDVDEFINYPEEMSKYLFSIVLKNKAKYKLEFALHQKATKDKMVKTFETNLDYHCIKYYRPDASADITISAQHRKSHEYFSLKYLGGHPDISTSNTASIIVDDEKIEIEVWPYKAHIPFADVKTIKIETQEQIKNRITATRLLLVGVFALAWKKEETKVQQYLTIDFVDNINTEFTVVFSGKACARVHSEINKWFYSYKRTHPTNEEQKEKLVNLSLTEMEKQTTTTKSPAEQIKEFKELLDLGAISQEEYDKKKKELLEL